MDEAQLRPHDSVAAFEDLPFTELRRAWDSSPAIVAVTLGPEHLLVYQNRASQAMFGVRSVPMPLAEAFPEVSGAGLAPMDRVLATGQEFEVLRRQVGVRDVTGGDVVLRYVLAPLCGLGEPPRGVVITAIDVTAEARAAEAVARAELLAELSGRLTAATSATAGLQALTDALVPGVVDLAAVYVVPGSADGGAETEPIPPQVMTIAESLAPLGPPPASSAREDPSPWDAILREGRPVVVAVNPESMPVVAPDAAAAQWLTRAAAHSIAVVPLVVAGSLTGAMLLMAAGDRPEIGPRDLPFLSDIAARAGAAIGRVWTQQREREVASRLQRALLPAAPPELAGLAVAARYIAGAPGVEVGGDWWDVQDLGGDRVGVGIGDVSGRGVSAAAVMGQARAAMHAAGQAQLPPAKVLELLDVQLSEVTAPGRLDEPASPQFATAAYAVVDRAAGVLRIANAGHLPPLVRDAAGRVRAIRLPAAAPLGLGIRRFTETTTPFASGDTLLMFTDGLVELRDQDLDDGIALLAAALERLGDQSSLDVLADQLLATMSHRPGYGHDDVALILVRPA